MRRRQIIEKAEQLGSCLAEVAGRLRAGDLQKGRKTMKFTPKFNVVPIVCGVLAITAVGLNEAVNRVGSTPAPIVVMQNTAVQESFQTNGHARIIYAVEQIPPASTQRVTGENFLPVAWYKNKYWWKRNAPIIGGAAGGALIGGLAGGGKGLIIGGAVGGGGGYCTNISETAIIITVQLTELANQLSIKRARKIGRAWDRQSVSRRRWEQLLLKAHSQERFSAGYFFGGTSKRRYTISKSGLPPML